MLCQGQLRERNRRIVALESQLEGLEKQLASVELEKEHLDGELGRLGGAKSGRGGGRARRGREAPRAWGAGRQGQSKLLQPEVGGIKPMLGAEQSTDSTLLRVESAKGTDDDE